MKLIENEIRYSTFVRASPEEDYEGIATAKSLDGWFTERASVDPRPGGEIDLSLEGFRSRADNG
jgi:uncharacterized protein YndB with AHSA1/START domain